MIKVGQIRKMNHEICVVTQYQNDVAMIIFQDGYAMLLSKYMMEKQTRLITEYSTWQEAVNSQEFNEVEK